MPDPVTTETTVEATPEPVKQDTPQNESREKLYQQYYKTDAPAEEQVAAPPAEPDFKALFTAQQAELTAIKEALKGFAPKPSDTPDVPTKVQEDWFALLQQGKRTEAEQVLKDYVAQGASEKIVQETVRQTLEVARTEREIEDYNNYIRANNADMLDVEDLVSLKAQQKFISVQPTIKTPKDYIEAYKKAVSESVEEMRNILRRTRAAGKNEGLTIRRDVLATSTVNPNKFELNRETQEQAAPEQTMPSTEDYMKMRVGQNYRARNPQVGNA